MIKQSSVFFSSLFLFVFACGNNESPESGNSNSAQPEKTSEPAAKGRHYRGALTGGMKGDSIFFDVSADGSKLENLTFKGYWYCNGKLEQSTAGPEGFFTLVNGKVNDHISEPPDGGATAWRFDLEATVDGKKANGNFRMNINALGCNTGTLKWEAVAD